jgi:uncharacterized protein YydD (DUF2326 family)
LIIKVKKKCIESYQYRIWIRDLRVSDDIGTNNIEKFGQRDIMSIVRPSSIERKTE